MADDRKITPDPKILVGIFPAVPGIPKHSYNIISNTFHTCTFRLYLDSEPKPGFPVDLLIRLEGAGSRLPAVAELQRLAQKQLPELVPATLEVGTVVDEGGRSLDYSITPFLTGATVLEDVWNSLSKANQQTLMDSIVVAIQRLQNFPATAAVVQEILHHDSVDTTPSEHVLVGGPDAGYHNSIKELLAALISQKAAKLGCEVVSSGDGIAVQSSHDDGGKVQFTNPDLQDLLDSIVFCHNDLEPRNILVRELGDEPNVTCELAAIIDWEMAGFFPFAYEYGLKDTFLGSCNLSFSWYSLFKERASPLLASGAGHKKLIEALAVIGSSNSQAIPRNVGVRFEKKWRERERVRLSPVHAQGWIRRDDAGHVPVFTKEDNEKLEVEVLKELGLL
ncbi:hypothetical protein QBC44DRAFT_231638 [Cladorrhinum sp. PSN332]|nr:hypothetical protein QBC44DRAFT_231638 [Cladorrhinum sp. PSN332]